LGRGKTIIYQDGVFSGECVLESAKPGENRVLPHCLENSVKISKDTKAVITTRASVRISTGIVFDESISSCSTIYTIENQKDESFKLLLEHDHVLGVESKISYHISGDAEGQKYYEMEKLSTGTRLYVNLTKKNNITVEVHETLSNMTKIILSSKSLWLVENIEFDSALSQLVGDEQFAKCISLENEINDCEFRIKEYKSEIDYLDKQTSRVRENLKAAKDVAAPESVSTWVKDLTDSEARIRELNKEIVPACRSQIKNLKTLLDLEYKKISVLWKEKTT